MGTMLVLPVMNAMLPHPHNGRLTGMFLMEEGGSQLKETGWGREILICPWNADFNRLYPVGVIARIVDMAEETALDDAGRQLSVLLVVLEGREHGRWHSLQTAGAHLICRDVEVLRLFHMRKEYPVISGAGWQPQGGLTQARGLDDIEVVIYGASLTTGQPVRICANLRNLVTPEQAHTVEHAIIRALRTCGLCSIRTLMEAMAQETDQLKQTLELGFRYSLPEVLGQTDAGSCGNPMTNLAQFYLAKEFVDNVRAGKSPVRSLVQARQATMSQLTQQLGLTSQSGLEVLQGLKKGMHHDDTALKVDICKKILMRFPFDPWR